LRPSFLIIDDFLTDPHVARAQALALGYDPAKKAGNYPGLMSDAPLVIAGLDDAASRLAGVKLAGAPGTMHGHCRLTLRADRGVTGVHIDPCDYSGILYLSLPDHCRGGTEFFRHRRTGLDAVPHDMGRIMAAGYADINALVEDVVNRDTRSPGKWERSFVAPMRFNRLILFSPWMFHNAAPGFGDRAENGRLIQTLFFKAG
jgi:Family of unknown function (DUF6445)